jgi:hypothetical protein
MHKNIKELKLNKKYPGLNIPKRHSLKHLMKLVGRLYGESEENLNVYVDEQLKANENNLDGAIACFESLIPESERQRLEAEERSARFANPKK